MESGAILGGKYRLISPLGSGGMGTVWRAEHLGLRAPIAIKVLGPAISPTPEALARFHREAQSAARLRSPHVVQILDHGIDEATKAPFIAMELLEGESLAERLARVGRLTPVETLRVATHIARALTRAHELQIVHRDLKPGNVFLVRNDDEETLKVLDFGLAKWDEIGASAPDVATVTGTFLGTAYYMSPEQVAGEKADQRADLWAFAVVVFECLTGQRPFDADNVLALATRISSGRFVKCSTLSGLRVEFDAWFGRAFAVEVERRFQSAREMTEELRRLCAPSELPVEAASGSAPRVAIEPHEPAAEPTPPPAQMEQTVACFNPDGTLADPGEAELASPKPKERAETSVEPLSRTVEPKRARRSLGVVLGGASALALLSIVGVGWFARRETSKPGAVAAEAVVAVSATPARHDPPPSVGPWPSPAPENVAAAEPAVLPIVGSAAPMAKPAEAALGTAPAAVPTAPSAPPAKELAKSGRASPTLAPARARAAASASASAAASAPDVFRSRK